MARSDMNTVTIEGATLVFRNFSGKESMYNREGDRNFGVLLDEETASAMAEDGWNVKALKSREEGEPDQPYISVSLSYKYRPPRVVLITSRGRTLIDEDMVETLDWAEIETADMVLRPYEWAVNGKTGVKAYLQSLYVTIVEDPLELKYADMEDVQ